MHRKGHFECFFKIKVTFSVQSTLVHSLEQIMVCGDTVQSALSKGTLQPSYGGQIKAGSSGPGFLLTRWTTLFGGTGNPVAVSVTSRHQGHQRRPAQRGRYIPPRKENAFFGELVYVRRPNVWVTHEAVVCPPLVIRNDQDDVRGRNGRNGSRRKQQCYQ